MKIKYEKRESAKKLFYDFLTIISWDGAMTLSIMTFSIMTFSIMTFSIMTFSIMTFSIMTINNITFS